MPVDDPGFVKQIQAGQPQALETVVRTYLGQILRAAREQDSAPRKPKRSLKPPSQILSKRQIASREDHVCAPGCLAFSTRKSPRPGVS